MSIKIVDINKRGYILEGYDLVNSWTSRAKAIKVARKFSELRKKVIVERGLAGEVWYVWVKRD